MLNIDLPPDRSAFLWGPRKTGKTYWVNRQFADSILIDLLKTDVFADYASRPSLIRERYKEHRGLIVIDEIQMVPDLLNEIHWLIENTNASFLMTGSRPRKLRRGHANLLGGRAWRYKMSPLTFAETSDFDLGKSEGRLCIYSIVQFIGTLYSLKSFSISILKQLPVTSILAVKRYIDVPYFP